MYEAILQYTVETLLLDANILRDSILVRMEHIHFECYMHVNASMWRLVYRELRALTNDSTLNLNPLQEHLVQIQVTQEEDAEEAKEEDLASFKSTGNPNSSTK